MKEKREAHKLIEWHYLDAGIAKLLKAYVSALKVCIPVLNPS